MISATYSAEDDKIRLYASSRLPADVYARVKAAGFKWAPKQDLFVAPSWSPAREDIALELAGEIDDEDISLTERAADRAERFEGYREKRADEANGTADGLEASGQVFGHQDARRAQRQADRYDRGRNRAVSQWSKAEYWQTRTAGVISHALHKSSPAVRRSRILVIEADARKLDKSRDEYAARFSFWSKVPTLDGAGETLPMNDDTGNRYPTTPAGKLAYTLASTGGYVSYKHPRAERSTSLYGLLTDASDPLTPAECAALWLAGASDPSDPDSGSARWANHYALRLSYERAMLANEGGSAAAVEMVPGGWINTSSRTGSVFTHVESGWKQIQAVNKSPATGRVTSVKVLGRVGVDGEAAGMASVNIERLGEGHYRAPTAEELEAFTEATKQRKAAEKASKPAAPPLINPTMADAIKLQTIWNERAAEAHKRHPTGGNFVPLEVLTMTQAEWSQRSKGSYSSFETIEVSERLRRRRQSVMGNDTGGRVTVFKIRRAPSPGYSFTSADRVVVLTDKPQKAIPWDAVEAAREEQPTVENMTPRIAEVYKAVSAAWLPGADTAERKLIDDAFYLGWVYISSQSQFGLTPEGLKVYNENGKTIPAPLFAAVTE